MGNTIELTASDGHRLTAYAAKPDGAPRGGLVIIQTAFGVDAYLRGVCDSYARDGYLSIAPALYDRQRRDAVFEHNPEGQSQAQKFRNGFVWDDVLRDVDACRQRVASAGRVGTVGFCVGGSVVWLAARSQPFAAAASYYGKDVVDFLDRAPDCPTILHFGDKDHLIAASDVEKIRAAFPAIPNYLYHAGHGFDGNNPEAARIARARTLDLFRAHVG
jgi:carboxymethylenebutenolidase